MEVKMREGDRIERILTLIRQIWEKQPDIRFNQLIINLSWMYANKNNENFIKRGYSKFENEQGIIMFTKDVVYVDLFYLEDDEFEKFLKEYLRTL
jgi:hypothetical protein